MRFWDSSAIVPLVVLEATSASLDQLFSRDPAVTVWWSTSLECVSAVARLERQGSLTAQTAAEAIARLDELATGWAVVHPVEEALELARRFVRIHPLRAADALQLAAAFLTAERRPPTLELVTLDDRMREAAMKEGFVVAAV